MPMVRVKMEKPDFEHPPSTPVSQQETRVSWKIYIYIYHHIETKQKYIYGCEFNSMKVPDGAKRSKVHHASSSQSASPEADTVPAVPWLLVPSFVIGICSQ